MNRWPKSKISNVINSIHPADQSFVKLLSDKDMFFAFEGVDGGQRSRFEEQYFNEWLTFLDQPQIQIRDEIVKAVQTNLTGFECTLLLGGPGTGKTVVLTSAANQLAKLGMNSRFEVPPGVKDQLIATGNFLPRSNQNWNAFFLDDPIALDDLEEAIVETRSLNRQLIVAIDPTQWRERKTIERFHELLRTEKPKILELRHGYRQGGAIGREAVKMVHTFLKKSSAYSEQSKRDSERAKAKRWENLCLKELNFSDNNGTWIIGSQAADGNYLVKALQAFDLAAEFKSEKTWPNVLVALSNPNNLPPGLRTLENYAKHKYPKLNIRHSSYRDVQKIRGTEFEAVIMFISEEDWSPLVKGLIGAKTTEWERVSQILTFFTRAENVLAILPVLDNFQADFAFERTGQIPDNKARIFKIFGRDLEHR
jgi:hypothetical protein